MSHFEVTTETWFDRLLKSIGSVAGGSLLFLISLLVLFFNEGRAVQTEKSLNEGAAAVKTVPADKVDPAFEGKLVHLMGEAKTDQVLKDPDFNVSANAVRLERTVEMYQWKEKKTTEKHKLSNGDTQTITHYDYEKEWSSSAIDSEEFSEPEHENPEMTYTSKHWSADDVSFGAFKLSPALIDKLDDRADLPLTEKEVKAAPKDLHATLDDTSLYLGDDPASPDIGDVRVSYEIVKPGPASVVAVQQGDSFVPWKAPSGDDVLLLQGGQHTAAQMFEQAQSDNAAMTVFLRILGWLMMLVGLWLVFKPLAVIADRVPLMGTLLQAGLGLFTFLFTSALSTFIIGLAWLFYRPLAGIALLAVAGGALFALRKLAKSRSAKATEAMGIQVRHTVIEQQSPDAVSLPATDSVVKGKFEVASAKNCEVLSMKAQFVMDIRHQDGRTESVVLGEDLFPDEYTSRADDMLQYPYKLQPNQPQEDFFSIGMTDAENNSFSVAEALQKRGLTPDQASFFVRTSVQVKGLPQRPETKTPIQVV